MFKKNVMNKNISKKYINDLTYEVNAAIIEVHKILGPGLIESVYHKCLKHELKLRNISFVSEATLPFSYKDLDLTIDFRCDLLVEGCLMLELKAVQEIIPFFKAKLIGHMKMAEIPKGILINFNVLNIMKEGHWVFKNDYYDDLSEI
jgi:GxxExxY protein